MRRADLGVRSTDFSMERRGVVRGLDTGVGLVMGFLLFQIRSTNLISLMKASLKVSCNGNNNSKISTRALVESARLKYTRYSILSSHN